MSSHESIPFFFFFFLRLISLSLFLAFGFFILSLLHHDRVGNRIEHLYLACQADGSYRLESGAVHSSLDEIVDHYQTHYLEVINARVLLVAAASVSSVTTV